ncbi:MAG: LysM peptidoglycan-binding domain-containing protein [Treponema sp.]|nr:LysM peptidoglycan-binding domain-containing protein [Treponema sp.]
MKLSEKKITVIISFLLVFHLSAFCDSVYKVEKGDTLYSISKKYQITVAELRTANNLGENDVIKIGQKLTIPSADIATAAALATDNSTVTKDSKLSKENEKNDKTTVKTVSYEVVKGDTLYGIARKTGMTVADLLSLNGLDSSSVIKIGQKLKIIDTSATSTKTETKVTENVKTENKNESKTTEKKEETKSSGPAQKNDDKSKTPNAIVVDTRNYGNTVNADSSTIWPVKNPKITIVNGKVSGVQLSAQNNENVTCIREGTVMYVGVYRGFGQVLFVQSKTGIIYSYAGLGSVKVKKGDYVDFGAILGTAGVDSITNKSQITFMVFQNGKPIDPAKAPRN